ncbi:MAG: restriction endonuclease [Desulfobulbaceae bacterium]|nr:restriction endonuclease [Desulfobulbaceae bacterium]
MDIALLEKLDLETFEKACQVLFDQMGFVAKSTGTGSMPGIGEVMVLYSKSSNAPFALLQCAEAGARVELIQLAQVKNSMAKQGLSNGYLVTVETAGQLVRDFATANKINLIDGAKFVELISNLPENGRNLLRETLASGQVSKSPGGAISTARYAESSGPPTCAKCGATMKLQVKQDGIYRTGKYWQCPYPGCGYISAYI